MMRTAADLFVGAHIRTEDGETFVIDWVEVDDYTGNVKVEGYELDGGQGIEHTYDPDDEINIVKGE